jgi:hypothetical protein
MRWSGPGRVAGGAPQARGTIVRLRRAGRAVRGPLNADVRWRMRMRYHAPLLLILVGCVSSPGPSLNVDGYERVRIPQGCYKHVSEKDHNIQLSSKLESHLLGLLPHESSAARCWYERQNSNLLLALGNECGPHQLGTFEKVGDAWKLSELRNVPLVHCNVRRQ